VVIEGVFEADDAGGARFHEAQGVGPETIAEIQTRVRRVCCMRRRGGIEREEAQAMGAWDHGGGFSLDVSVRIDRIAILRISLGPAAPNPQSQLHARARA